ncbi:uncharacterized protein [Manis javanica]|uniref:uncharacterized protein n=1 Tax=Manis javanica TaxID=9974 RepID=UPI003C6CF134
MHSQDVRKQSTVFPPPWPRLGPTARAAVRRLRLRTCGQPAPHGRSPARGAALAARAPALPALRDARDGRGKWARGGGRRARGERGPAPRALAPAGRARRSGRPARARRRFRAWLGARRRRRAAGARGAGGARGRAAIPVTSERIVVSGPSGASPELSPRRPRRRRSASPARASPAAPPRPPPAPRRVRALGSRVAVPAPSRQRSTASAQQHPCDANMKDKRKKKDRTWAEAARLVRAPRRALFRGGRPRPAPLPGRRQEPAPLARAPRVSVRRAGGRVGQLGARVRRAGGGAGREARRRGPSGALLAPQRAPAPGRRERPGSAGGAGETAPLRQPRSRVRGRRAPRVQDEGAWRGRPSSAEAPQGSSLGPREGCRPPAQVPVAAACSWGGAPGPLPDVDGSRPEHGGAGCGVAGAAGQVTGDPAGRVRGRSRVRSAVQKVSSKCSAAGLPGTPLAGAQDSLIVRSALIRDCARRPETHYSGSWSGKQVSACTRKTPQLTNDSKADTGSHPEGRVEGNKSGFRPRHGLETALVCKKDLPRMKDLGHLPVMIVLEPQRFRVGQEVMLNRCVT